LDAGASIKERAYLTYITPPSLRRRVQQLRGSTIESDLRSFAGALAAIRLEAGTLAGQPDADIRARAKALRARVLGGAAEQDVLVEAFALVCEAAFRQLGIRLFDVQLLAGLALHQARIVEMQTGEGKTVAAVAPAYLAALGGAGVHVLTVNDYLARRDARWMGPIYEILGLRVGFVQEKMPREDRRAAYGCDVTYVTAREAGFDFLRDRLCLDPADLGPSSTWTYLVTDKPFVTDPLASLVARPSLGLPLALAYGPLFILWGIFSRWRARKRKPPSTLS
jgi:preprotein translocase subunit SecA